MNLILGCYIVDYINDINILNWAACVEHYKNKTTRARTHTHMHTNYTQFTYLSRVFAFIVFRMSFLKQPNQTNHPYFVVFPAYW